MRPVTTTLVVLVSAALSTGCRSSRVDAPPDPGPPPIPMFEGDYDSPRPLRVSPPDGPLLPTPDGRTGSRRSRGTIPVPAPGVRQSRKAPPMPTARRGTVLFPSEADRGLMPASESKSPFSLVGWPFRRDRADETSEGGELGDSTDVDAFVDHDNAIERAFRSRPTPTRSSENPVRVVGIEFEMTHGSTNAGRTVAEVEDWPEVEMLEAPLPVLETVAEDKKAETESVPVEVVKVEVVKIVGPAAVEKDPAALPSIAVGPHRPSSVRGRPVCH